MWVKKKKHQGDGCVMIWAGIIGKSIIGQFSVDKETVLITAI